MTVPDSLPGSWDVTLCMAPELPNHMWIRYEKGKVVYTASLQNLKGGGLKGTDVDWNGDRQRETIRIRTKYILNPKILLPKHRYNFWGDHDCRDYALNAWAYYTGEFLSVGHGPVGRTISDFKPIVTIERVVNFKPGARQRIFDLYFTNP